MLRARTATSHNAKMTAKIANTGPLREIQSASQLGVAGDVAAIVVMTISLQTEHHRAGKSLLALELPGGAHGQLFRSSCESRLRRRGRKRSPWLRPSSQPSRLGSH